MRICLASHNPDKCQEFKEILQDPRIELWCPESGDPCLEVEENGRDYQANALIKAKAAYAVHGGPVLADDSGLSVDALDGYPGIYSARFAGVETSYPDKIEALYSLLKALPHDQWTASFHCALVYLDARGQVQHFAGRCDGLLIPEARGENGFGYDPIFYIPALKMTTAEMCPEAKHAISHRGKALRLFQQYLAKEEAVHG